MSQKESMLDAFNARDLTPASVARSFVPSPKYTDLAQATHSILIGPRGSGKTTLLKMLSLDALRAWEHGEADSYRNRISYTGIFVPADITWGAMVDSLADDGRVPSELGAVLGEVAFGINVFMAATDAMAKRLPPAHANGSPLYRQAVVQSPPNELIRFIADIWKLKLHSISFRGVGQALNARLADLYAQAKRLSHLENPTVALLHEEAPYTTLDIFASLTATLNEFNSHIGEEHGRWAVLLDEFEVVPAHIQQQVLHNLRAANNRLIFKVALAPCGAQTGTLLKAASSPNEVDDVKRIELWYRDKNEVISFCRSLFESRMHAKGIHTPAQMLGNTEIIEDAEELPEPSGLFNDRPTTSWGQNWWATFHQLAAHDAGFREFLSNKKIDIKDLRSSPSLPNGNTLRKIAPIVAFRAAYRDMRGKKIGRKPFRTPYVGWEAIASISEGNPRWLIGMLEGLEREMGPDSDLPLSAYAQWSQVIRTSNAFMAKIKTVAIEDNMGITTTISVAGLLDRIGAALHNDLVTGNFVEDPYGTFIVDEKIDSNVESCLRIALNFGGLVCFDPPDHVAGYDSLVGKQFRLAYILAPKYRLPLRKGRSRSLSALLSGSESSSRPSASKGGDDQRRLF